MSQKKKRAQQVVSFKSTNSLDLDEPQSLISVTPNDNFPCYSCFDRPIERMRCDVCAKKGFLTGDHPMVKFVDQFLNQNLPQTMKKPSKGSFLNSSQHGSHSSEDSQSLCNSKTVPSRKKVKSALGSYPETLTNSSTKLMESSQSRSSKPIQSHIGFSCDLCESDPIRGARYHCETCEDFDLC